MEAQSNVREDYQKREFILGCDYTNYPQPLKEYLEKRQFVYKTCYENYEEEDFKQLIDCIEDKIKLILTL